jgi:hypothetical protein
VLWIFHGYTFKEFWTVLTTLPLSDGLLYGRPHWESASGRNCDPIPRTLATSPLYAELRALEQLDETVAECIGAAAEDGISADDLEKAAGGSLKEYLRTAIINTSE